MDLDDDVPGSPVMNTGNLEDMMKKLHTATIAALLLASTGAITSPAFAQDAPVYWDRARGELSEGTGAPTQATILSAINTGSTTQLFSVLEYGERVECQACVPLLEEKLLTSNDAKVREIAAWWLRRRIFASGPVLRHMTTVLATDTNATQRSRAAEAIGEFMDFHGLAALAESVSRDVDAGVRESSVRAIARINAPSGNALIAVALADTDVSVRRAAVSAVLRVNFFRNVDALVPLLADTDATVRRNAARAIGELRVAGAEATLAGLLRGDSDRLVRQSAAWALGRIGSAAARTALAENTGESDSLVRDAIDVARLMR